MTSYSLLLEAQWLSGSCCLTWALYQATRMVAKSLSESLGAGLVASDTHLSALWSFGCQRTLVGCRGLLYRKTRDPSWVVEPTFSASSCLHRKKDLGFRPIIPPTPKAFAVYQIKFFCCFTTLNMSFIRSLCLFAKLWLSHHQAKLRQVKKCQ